MSGSVHDLPRLGRHSPRFKFVRALRRATGRRSERATLLEGPNLLDAYVHASDLDVEQSGLAVRLAVFSASYSCPDPIRGEVLRVLRARGVECVSAADRDFALLSDTAAPQGILLVASTPEPSDDFPPFTRALLTDGVSDPGNFGTLVRSAAAFGVDSVIAAGGVDPFAPKALRSSAGAVFRVRCRECNDSKALVEYASKRGFAIAAAVATGGAPPSTVVDSPGLVLIVGSESHGIRADLLDAATHLLTIPMSGRVESLNAAVAGSILLYAIESARG